MSEENKNLTGEEIVEETVEEVVETTEEVTEAVDETIDETIEVEETIEEIIDADAETVEGAEADEFAETKSGKWLAENASKYGFSLSFPQGYEPVSGYRWECWHYRYIGHAAVFMQEKWFNNIQQYMFDFINFYRTAVIDEA